MLSTQTWCAQEAGCVVPIMMRDSTLPVGTIRGVVIEWNPMSPDSAGTFGQYRGAVILDHGTGARAQAGAGGAFELTGLKAGWDTLTAAYIGYQRTTVAVQMPGRGGLRLLIVLQAASIVSSDDRFSGEPMGTDADWSADSNLVSDPSWISGTVAKNVLTVAFKQGTSMARQEALIASVHGEVIDEMDVRISDVSPEYTIRVPTHPDACGVKQALDFLNKAPEVEMAIPELVFTTDQNSTVDPGSGLIPAPATHHGSSHPCPPGVSLLK
ncbi:MAG TPA: hypothetical protein VN674_08005 [Gemmatimonadales bacterium]|nr:hypothetical protein [Gemmatimonadales bacterium]